MSIVKEALMGELRDAINLSKKYSNIVKTAKTKPKVNLYKKKLEKNNQIVADMMIALDKLEKS